MFLTRRPPPPSEAFPPTLVLCVPASPQEAPLGAGLKDQQVLGVWGQCRLFRRSVEKLHSQLQEKGDGTELVWDKVTSPAAAVNLSNVFGSNSIHRWRNPVLRGPDPGFLPYQAGQKTRPQRTGLVHPSSRRVSLMVVVPLQDDPPAMDFVTAAANLRMHIFSMNMKSLFDVKCKLPPDLAGTAVGG